MLNIPVLSNLIPPSTKYLPYLNESCHRYEINTWLRRVHYLTQVTYESQVFGRVVENLNYSVVGLLSTFGRHRITTAQAEKYGRKPGQSANRQAIANTVYGGAWGARNLGNTLEGDGYKFRGRGLMQITGRDNYTRMSRDLFQSDILLSEPELLEDVRWAALSSGVFWGWKRCNALADDDDLRAITRVINGGYNGLTGTGGREWWLRQLKLEL